MRAQLILAWGRARDSLWLIPGGMTLLAAALALLLVHLERKGWVVWDEPESWWVGIGVEGARGVLSAIAGGLITVTGVVFSVTIVALQLASSQFTPRVLRNFAADRVNQTVLGVFIGTFTYTLLVLGVIRSGEHDGGPFVPTTAVGLGILLVLLSIGFLIFFINHAASSMRVSVILARVTQETLAHIRRYFPHQLGESRPETAELGYGDDDWAPIAADKAGYMEVVDDQDLLDLGESRDLVIRMECDAGQFVHKGQHLASVAPKERVDEHVVHAVRLAFALGAERTAEQDVEFGLMEISDIAVKALSSSINDPTTVSNCIDRLTQLLIELGQREPAQARRTPDGKIRFIPRHLSFERAVGVSFNQIIHYGVENPAIVRKLLTSLLALAELVPPQRHQPLAAQLDILLIEAERPLRASHQRLELERMVEDIRRLFGSGIGDSDPLLPRMDGRRGPS